MEREEAAKVCDEANSNKNYNEVVLEVQKDFLRRVEGMNLSQRITLMAAYSAILGELVPAVCYAMCGGNRRDAIKLGLSQAEGIGVHLAEDITRALLLREADKFFSVPVPKESKP